MARIGAGYQAKIACSEIFVAGRNAKDIIEGEFNDMDPAMELIGVKVDEKQKRVRAGGPFGFGGVRAVYREGYGCTLANAGHVSSLPEPAEPIEPAAWEEAPPVSGQSVSITPRSILRSPTRLKTMTQTIAAFSWPLTARSSMNVTQVVSIGTRRFFHGPWRKA
jgi:hypothetical protein